MWLGVCIGAGLGKGCPVSGGEQEEGQEKALEQVRDLQIVSYLRGLHLSKLLNKCKPYNT